MKKALSVLLTLCMVLSAFICVPFSVSAAEAGETGTTPNGNTYKVPQTVTIYDNVYYRISSAEEFCYIELEPSAKYALVADIELPSTYVPVASFSGWLRGYDDSTIKNNAAVPKLNSIKLNSTNGTGLFTAIASTGKAFQYIKTAGSVTTSTNKNCGAFASTFGGSSYAYFDNCENEAAVSGMAGAFVGGFFGVATGYPVFGNCVNSGEIKTGEYVGGFIGKSEGGIMAFNSCVNKGIINGGGLLTGGFGGDIKTPTLDKCANLGSVTGYRVAGGLLGGYWSTNGGASIKNSYNAGAVTSNASSGMTGASGIVGMAVNKVTITDCFNAGALTAASGVKGAFIATLTYGSTTGGTDSSVTTSYSTVTENLVPDGVTTVNCFYLDAVTNEETGALSEADMKDSTKFTGFNFSDTDGVWEMNPEGSDYPYPQLIENTYIVEIEYGTSENPYLITSGEEFVSLITQEGANNKYYKLVNDISLGDEASGSSYNALDFSGNLDGNGKKINIYIDNGLDKQGLFSSTLGEATITNLTLEGTIIANSQAGGFVALANKKVTFENCVNNADVSALQKEAGGFVGYSSGSGSSYTECINNGSIDSSDKAAGFVAGSEGGTNAFENCVNNGNIGESVPSFSGGIAGYVKYATLTNCANNGAVKAYRYAGGIWAYRTGTNTSTVKITGCYNTGAVSSEVLSTNSSLYYAAGGIIGNVATPEFTTSSGVLTDGGVELTSCYNAGTVSAKGGNTAVGGLVGGRFSLYTMTENTTVLININNCYNIGDIYGADGVVENAPIVFATDNVNKIAISNCYYLAVETEVETDSYDDTIAVALEEFAEGVLGNTNCYEESANDYIYPQIPGNINTIPVNMYLVTVAEAENGKISSEGKVFYAKGGNILTFEAEGDTLAYSVVTITVNDSVYSSSPVEVEITGDTAITASFAQPEFAVVSADTYNGVISLGALGENNVDTSGLAGKFGAICFAKFSGIYNDGLIDYGVILSKDNSFDLASDEIISKIDSGSSSAVTYFYGAKELKDTPYYMTGYIKFTNSDGNEEVIYGDAVSFSLGFVINDI